jgi:two-component system response regulator RegX3
VEHVARVLVLDDESLSDALSAMLYGRGYEVSVTGPSAVTEFDRGDAGIVLLDLVLPGVSGTEVCQRLQNGSRVPVVMIADQDGGIGGELGVDELLEGYPPGELVARIRAALGERTAGAGNASASILEAGPVRMDVDRHTVTVAGSPVKLPLKEFELLETLLRDAGRVLTRSQLIAQVWGTDYVGDTKTLDVHVKRLRSKIEPTPANPRHIVNIRSLGFKFEP